MKLLETRQVSDEIRLMSWSPKMDLIALGTTKGEIILHRLSWQKVWQIKVFESPVDDAAATVPTLMTWHPDGIFLAICADKSCCVVDVECGKLIHRHEFKNTITATKWCPTDYELSMGEVLATQARQQSDFLRNELKFQRLESLLSALIIATDDGLVRVYTGGFLFGIALKVPDSVKGKVMQVDTTRNLQSFQFLLNHSDSTGRNLSLSNFKTEHFRKVSNVVGPLGFKYIFFLKSWSLILGEITSLNDQWSKLVDIYNSYMTYGSDKELNEVKADYMELLFTGISTVELEIFLGKVGREKEIKKHTNAVNSISGSIMEHLRNIKCATVFVLLDLNEIGGFLKISHVNGARDILADLRKAFNYLYIGILHIQVLIQSFVEKFMHFFHLLLNTVHFFNIQEVPDFIEEDSDVDSVLEFLDMKVGGSVFELLIQNAPLKFKDSPPCLEHTEIPLPSATKKNLSERSEPQFPFVKLAPDKKWKSFSAFMLEFMDKHPEGFVGRDFILDFSQGEVLQLFSMENLPNVMSSMIDELLRIPALSTLPFSASTYPIASLPAINEESAEICGIRVKQDGNSSIVYVLTNSITYLFVINLAEKSPSIRSYSLKYSKKVLSCDLFSDTVLTLLSIREDEAGTKEGEGGGACGTIYQLNLDKIMDNSAAVVDMHKFLANPRQKFAPSDVFVDLASSMDSTKGSEYSIFESSVAVDTFIPLTMAVSGARKLGAVLSESKKQVLLVDMEPDSGDNSFEDEGTAEFSSETLSEVSL